MPITLKGVRLENIAIGRGADGEYSLTSAEYSLISSTDKVLAKQTIGGYNGMVLAPSPATVKALKEYVTLYRADIVAVLGLED